MRRTKEEKGLLAKLASGDLDGLVGNDLNTSGGSRVWKSIKNGIPGSYKQGPERKFFDGRENVRFSGVLHTLMQWKTDDEKLNFLQRFGWLMKDADVKAYSAKFKTKK